MTTLTLLARGSHLPHRRRGVVLDQAAAVSAPCALLECRHHVAEHSVELRHRLALVPASDAQAVEWPGDLQIAGLDLDERAAAQLQLARQPGNERHADTGRHRALDHDG